MPDAIHIIDGKPYTWRDLPGCKNDSLKKRLNFALLRKGVVTLNQLIKDSNMGHKSQAGKIALKKRKEAQDAKL